MRSSGTIGRGEEWGVTPGPSTARTRTDSTGKEFLRFDDHLRRISVALFASGMLVVLFVANFGPAGLGYAVDRTALNLVVAVAGVSILGVLLFPWRRYDRNLFLVVSLGSICLITMAVYFSGGWASPFFSLYFFVVAFAALYYSARVAALVVFLTILASLGPEIYDPAAARLAEHAMVRVPSYLALAFVSWYMAQEIGRRERLRGESERKLGEMRELRDRFRREAYTDRLTGLPNRAHFDDLLQKEIKRARRHGENFALVFFDVDDFKLVNDVRGHEVGDDVLRFLAEVLRNSARETDTVARQGGEEFTALLPGTPLTGAREFFERVRLGAAHRGELKLGFPLRLSGGVAVFPQDAEDPDDLLKAADLAMYKAKRQGKDRLYHPHLDAG